MLMRRQILESGAVAALALPSWVRAADRSMFISITGAAGGDLAREGAIDIVGFLKALQKIGYRGAVSPESLGRFPTQTPEEAARLSYAATLAVMKKAGVI